MRDDAVRMLSRPAREAWLTRNTRYNSQTGSLMVWNIITWEWCPATSENILELCPLSVRGFGDPGDIWKDVRSKAARQSYAPQRCGDAPVYSEAERSAWLRESRRRKCLPERIEIFNVIQGRWVVVTQENLAEHYSRSYWEPIGLCKAWEEIEAGAVADPEAELTLQEHAEFLAEHLFGTRRKSPETPDERISVIVEEFDPAREEQERAPPPPPQQLPTFEERLYARMPEVLEVWATSQKGHITSRLVVEGLLQYQWPLSTIHQRTFAQAMRQAGWTSRRNAKMRFWVKNA
ncbi:hypothetical protein NKW54_12145 [Acetobacter cerevisiae]|uniref:Uncharacterized protein n=1 Tax=Acetobacter cerevisiae TaxID=178900 RepID=A0ABT1EU24_9PROT|nr:hypothetical protein [Acetobacter cerevisiae]MCP1246687.1 hypothetical protein [Acetobacter cerevisiae]MCP1256212.1 hypothetical protein [Acetobacter cerevisiae]